MGIIILTWQFLYRLNKQCVFNLWFHVSPEVGTLCEAALIRRVVCYLWSLEEASVDRPCLVGVTSSGNRKQCQDASLPLVSILGKKSAQSPLNASLPRKSKIAQSLICFEYHRVLVASISQVSFLLIQTHVSSFPFKVPLGGLIPEHFPRALTI